MEQVKIWKTLFAFFCLSYPENERALDPEEKPHQFTEHNSSKPLIFLRMKASLL